MKKFIIIILALFLMSGIAYAEQEAPSKDQKVDMQAIQILILQQKIKILEQAARIIELENQSSDMDDAAEVGASANSYTVNNDPSATLDYLLGIDDFGGTWTVNRFDIEDLLKLVTETTGNLTIGGDIVAITGDDLMIGTADTGGVKLTSDGDGALTILGSGAGSDESIIINLDDTADEITISSGSSATVINFSALDLLTTGDINGAVKIVTTTDGSESPTAAQMSGTFFIADNATAANDTDYTLPTAVAGMSACFYDNGAGTGGIIVDAAADDQILLNGATVGLADAIDSPGVAGDGENGDFICILAIDATNWITLGASGTWVDGGAD